MSDSDIRRKLNERGLKVTPQRVAVLKALSSLHNHPDTEDIVGRVRSDNPNISTGTIYSILDTLVEKGLVRRVKTERDRMRYDSVFDHHHHLYDTGSERIVDFFDSDLDDLIGEYFLRRGIPGFEIHDIRLHLTGEFTGDQPDGSDY